MKAEIKVKSSSIGSESRKKLSDITNMNSQQISPFKDLDNSLPSAIDDSSTNTYIHQLLKEMASLVMLIEEKDKIIEANGIEVQKLQVNLQKTQLQNLNLARRNSQIITELNMAKDRWKTQQHEIVCKDALLKAITLKLKEKTSMHREKNKFQGKGKVHHDKSSIQEEETISEETTINLSQEGNNDNKRHVPKTKRGRNERSLSMGPTTSQQTVDEETVEPKRRCLRRQSVMFKPPEKDDDLFQIKVANKLGNQIINSPQCKSADVKKCPSESSKSRGLQRSSIGRPPHKVSDRVWSYKDTPINTKMRRPVRAL